jgi:serine/threonine protein kinase
MLEQEMKEVDLDGISPDPDREQPAGTMKQLASGVDKEMSLDEKACKLVTDTPSNDQLTRVVRSTPPRNAYNSDKANAATRITQAVSNDSQPANSDRSVGVGSVLKARFLLEYEIARGGMGVVYRARDLLKEKYQDRNSHIAVKVLADQYKTHPDAFIALQREAGKAQKLAHPNICTVYDFDHDNDVVFMTMEYLEGQTLDKIIEAQLSNSLLQKSAFGIIESMCKGLTYAHSKGIVHSDFKPGNVMMMSDGTVKILDFGIASISAQHQKKTQEATLFDPSRRLGALTPAYASCEMIEWQEPDPRDDIYALACVSYELLSGRHPFNRVQATAARDAGLKPAPIKGLGKQQWKALQRGLAFDRKARTPSAEQFMSELSAVEPKRNHLVIAAVVVMLLFTVVSAYQLFEMISPDGQITLDLPLSQDDQEKISRLTEAAQVHFMVGRITDPPGSNAFAAYQQILEIEPGNAQAHAGMMKIADHYETLARKSWENGNIEQSIVLAETGLDVLPGHKGLTKLLSEIKPQSDMDSFTQWFRNLANH